MLRKIDEWQLFQLASGLTKAKRLEKLRADFHRELYLCITFPSVPLDPMIERTDSNVDSQAIRVIEAKERYERKIHKEYEQYFRWKDLLAWASDMDRFILIRYFQKKKRVEPKIMLQLLSRLEDRIAHEEKMVEMERTERSEEDYKNYQEQTRKFRKPVAVDEARQRYLIGGESFLMTPEEFAENQKRRKDDERFSRWKLDNNYAVDSLTTM